MKQDKTTDFLKKWSKISNFRKKTIRDFPFVSVYDDHQTLYIAWPQNFNDPYFR